MTDLQTMPSAAPAGVPETFEPITTAAEQSQHERHANWAAPTLFARVVAVAAAITVLFTGVHLTGGHPSEYVQLTTIMIVSGMASFGLVASHGVRAFGRLLAVVCGSPVRSQVEAEQLQSMCNRGRRLCYSGGVFAALVGVIHVLSVLDRPALIGPGMAIALIGPVTGLLFAELGFGAARHWMRYRGE